MPSWFKKVSQKAGLPPGSLVYVGESKVQKTQLSLIQYDQDKLKESSLQSSELPVQVNKNEVYWINVEGLVDVETVKKLGKSLKIHELCLEDILNTERRPKIDIFEDQIIVFFRMLMLDEVDGEILSEQVSLVLNPEGVITFQERPGDIFEPVRDRIRKKGGRIRQSSSDYLAYALIDSVVDQYFIILEKIGEQIDQIEDEAIETKNQNSEFLQKMYQLKKHVIFLKRSIWPLREVIEKLTKEESPLMKNEIQLYFRDIYEHVIHIIDTTELYREAINSIHDIYYSQVGQRLNETMKVLTIIATLFIPLTFIAGIYGMNFEWMPELKWKWGYPAALFLMFISSFGMLFFFRKKKWL